MFQNGQRVCFKNGGDPARIQKVQIAYGKDRSRAPQVIPTTDTNATQVQIVTGEDAARYPFIDPIGLIGAPAAWFRAGVGQTVTGSGVSTWADQSGNGRDLLQTVDASRPALQADGSVLFDGTADFLKTASFSFAQPESIYLVCKPISWTSPDTLFDGEAIGQGGGVYQTGVTPSISLFAGSSVAANTNLAVGSYAVLCAVINGAGSLLQINKTTPTTGDAGAQNMGSIRLGNARDGASFANLQALEMIAFSTAHDATQRARIISYLAGRYGIAL